VVAKEIAQAALRGVETVAPKLAASAEEGALNLLNVVGEKVLGQQGWKTTVETALRLGVMPRDVAVMARTGVLEGQKVGGRWLVSPSSVEDRLTVLAEKNIGAYPFCPRGIRYSYEDFDRALQSYQEQAAFRLKLTPAGLRREWLAPKPFSPKASDAYRLGSEDLWLGWRNTVKSSYL
jgi:hypothetical protein